MFLRLFERPLDSRLYVDLLYKRTSQFASFTPAHAIKLGDYGSVSKRTGEFIKEGNIFELDVIKRSGVTQASTETPDGHQRYSYWSRRGNKNSLGVQADSLVPVSGSAQLKLNYNKERHVTLVIRDPVYVELEYTKDILNMLAKHPDLKDKAIVTQYTKCSTYAILLTNGKAGEATISFTGNVPVAGTATVGANAQSAWNWTASEGSWMTGRYEEGKHPYSPLCTLRKVAKGGSFQDYNGRGGTPDSDGEDDDDDSGNFDVPWGELNDGGYDMDEGMEEGMEEWDT